MLPVPKEQTDRHQLLLFSFRVMSDSFVALWTVALQALLSMGFLRHEYWSVLPFFLQGIFLTQVSSLHFLYWQVESLLTFQ